MLNIIKVRKGMKIAQAIASADATGGDTVIIIYPGKYEE